ncbi:hypothetical protein C9374_000485 [Naegleria lovaniensis]|uniref:Uncharacterized protein n=1 Tax=Naegleria lovaniensis TaxID=51637 RepID=A0AA88GTW2_NAELO|nr:uncharacterized protein C9374_000485 [Naegleria lovaniensis]KAG2388321.1 hypothetical protein C9374_000485 [Naegleria lovaniensis]
MQFTVLTPLGESFNSHSNTLDELTREIESRLAYHVKNQNLVVLSSARSNPDSSLLRNRRQHSLAAATTDVVTNAQDDGIQTINNHPPNEATVTTQVILNPTWYPCFMEAYFSLVGSVVKIIYLNMKQRGTTNSLFRKLMALAEMPAVIWMTRKILLPILSSILVLLIGSCIMGICAQISITLPPSVSTVPITGQTFAVLWLGSLTGFILAPLSVMLYLFCGSVLQIPWFSNQSSGVQVLFESSSSGFLIGFVFSALVCGFCCSRLASDRTILMNLLMLALSNCVTFVFGCLWLAYGTPNLGLSVSIKKGLVPFLPGEIVKIVLVLVMVRLSWYVLYFVRGKVLKILEEKESEVSSTLSSEREIMTPVQVSNRNSGTREDVVQEEDDDEDNRCVSTSSSISHV